MREDHWPVIDVGLTVIVRIVTDFTGVMLTGTNEIATVGLVTTVELCVNFTVIPFDRDDAATVSRPAARVAPDASGGTAVAVLDTSAVRAIMAITLVCVLFMRLWSLAA